MPIDSKRQTIHADENFLRAEPPAREDLRSLIDALESFFRFRHGLNRCNPEILRAWRMQSRAHFLPMIFHMKDGSGQFSAEPQILRAGRGFEKAIAGSWRKQIDNRFHPDHHCALNWLLQLETNLAGNFATAGRRPKEKIFVMETGNRFVSLYVSADQRFATEFRLVWSRIG